MLVHRVGLQRKQTGLGETWLSKKPIAPFNERTQHSQSRFLSGKLNSRRFSMFLYPLNTFSFRLISIRAAYNLLLEQVPAPVEAECKRFKPEDYKLINFWYKHQWISASANRVTDISAKIENENENEDEEIEVDADGEDLESAISPAPGARRGQGRCRAGINVSMRYIQDKDGKTIDGHRAREIRIHARAIFVGFAMQGKQFASWGDADATSRKFFYNEMVIRFEELEYCDLDWKAEQIATDTFPGWKATWLKKQKKVLLEQRNGLKRSRQKSITDSPDLEPLKSTETSAPMSSSNTSQVARNSFWYQYLNIDIE